MGAGLADRIADKSMAVVSATEFRSRLGEYLTLAQAGVPVCVKRKHGLPVYLVCEGALPKCQENNHA